MWTYNFHLTSVSPNFLPSEYSTKWRHTQFVSIHQKKEISLVQSSNPFPILNRHLLPTFPQPSKLFIQSSTSIFLPICAVHRSSHLSLLLCNPELKEFLLKKDSISQSKQKALLLFSGMHESGQAEIQWIYIISISSNFLKKIGRKNIFSKVSWYS